MKVERAVEDLKDGKFVLIHDSSGRENETDMVIAAEKVKPNHIAQMRRDAGGLICVAIHPKVAKELGLPYMSDIYKSARSNHDILNAAEADDIPYDERSAFSITVNHRDTFTGITDTDRSLTIKELGKLCSRTLNGNSASDFGKIFRTPGHVPLLRAADNLLEDRRGHTELSIALMELADISPAAVVCEMLDHETGRALSKEKAEEYAEKEKLIYMEGSAIQQKYFSLKEDGVEA